MLTQKDTSTVLHKQTVFQNLQHCPQVAVQRVPTEVVKKRKANTLDLHNAQHSLIKGDSQLVCIYFPEIFGAFQPSQPLHIHREFSADTCASILSGIHKPERAVVGLYCVACAHCLSRKQTKPLQNIPFPSIDYKKLLNSNFQNS